jgi:hypothetical protein
MDVHDCHHYDPWMPMKGKKNKKTKPFSPLHFAGWLSNGENMSMKRLKMLWLMMWMPQTLFTNAECTFFS